MTTEQAGLGRLSQTDARNLEYPLPRRAVPAGVVRRLWNCPGVLDQGSTSQCVAYAGWNWLRSGPVTNRTMPFTIPQLYKWAQQRDQWPGENYDGTSGLGLMRALKEKQYITEYRWAFDVETIFAWILTEGPVLFGSNWTRDMFTPGNDGFIVVGGPNMGGHEYLLIGADRNRKCPDGTTGAVRMINSWGAGWGQKGRAWISKPDLARLLREDGDCCTATEIKVR